MKITLCGSARFEWFFKLANKRLSLAGHVVYSLAVYPSEEGDKDWYTEEQKRQMDAVHKRKIEASDAIYVIAPNGYIGESTRSEIEYARQLGKEILSPFPIEGRDVQRTCAWGCCPDPTQPALTVCEMCRPLKTKEAQWPAESIKPS